MSQGTVVTCSKMDGSLNYQFTINSLVRCLRKNLGNMSVTGRLVPYSFTALSAQFKLYRAFKVKLYYKY